MTTALPPVCFSITADLLAQCLERLASIDYAELPDCVARLDLGAVPVLYLDINSPPEDHCWALAEALGALTFGPQHAVGARTRRCLRLVS